LLLMVVLARECSNLVTKWTFSFQVAFLFAYPALSGEGLLAASATSVAWFVLVLVCPPSAVTRMTDRKPVLFVALVFAVASYVAMGAPVGRGRVQLLLDLALFLFLLLGLLNFGTDD